MCLCAVLVCIMIFFLFVGHKFEVLSFLMLKCCWFSRNLKAVGFWMCDCVVMVRRSSDLTLNIMLQTNDDYVFFLSLAHSFKYRNKLVSSVSFENVFINDI
jgi:hypothetical protein